LESQKTAAQIMSALFLVLVVSLIVAGVFLGGFLWSVRSEQFADKRGSSIRMLYDDAEPVAPGEFFKSPR
jgi:cbb3-type cytochrome oxidase maturation protein